MADKKQTGVTGSRMNYQDGANMVRAIEDDNVSIMLQDAQARIESYDFREFQGGVNVTLTVDFPMSPDHNYANRAMWFIVKAMHPSAYKATFIVLGQEQGFRAIAQWSIYKSTGIPQPKER